jgi:hypothetical protein
MELCLLLSLGRKITVRWLHSCRLCSRDVNILLLPVKAPNILLVLVLPKRNPMPSYMNTTSLSFDIGNIRMT